MKTKITVNGNEVTVEQDNLLSGRRESTTYFVPHTSNGESAYVRIRDIYGHYPQVCERLASTGNALMATPKTLPSVIRRELRREQRQVVASRWW